MFHKRAVVNGVRVIGFDNERGKGDHSHLDAKEPLYTFRSVGKLLKGFILAVHGEGKTGYYLSIGTYCRQKCKK
jgi:hypothetical protein